MSLLEVVFWLSLLLVIYPYLIYPSLLILLARLCARPVRRGPGGPRGVSFVVAARNEQEGIERRLDELLDLLERGEIDGEVIVVSDGSTDDTAAVVRPYTKGQVRLIELESRVGKAQAINLAVAQARHPIVVFADVRQRWAGDALALLLENFADPKVGAVSGDLEVTAAPGVLSGVGLYWRIEKWLRRKESEIGSQVGVTGAISAVRRELFRPLPAGTLLDDVYWPLQVALAGHRVIHDSRAVAYDHLPANTRDEFRRKVRTLAGNFQLMVRLPAALLPWRNPIWWQFISRKVLRLAVPWALLVTLVMGARLEGWVYRAVASAEVAGICIGLAGLAAGRRLARAGWPGKLLSSGASFLVLNTAAWVAFWVWLTGRAGQSWGKVTYAPAAAPRPAPPPVKDVARGEQEPAQLSR